MEIWESENGNSVENIWIKIKEEGSQNDTIMGVYYSHPGQVEDQEEAASDAQSFKEACKTNNGGLQVSRHLL